MASSFFGALTQGAKFDKKRFQQEIGLFKKQDGAFTQSTPLSLSLSCYRAARSAS